MGKVKELRDKALELFLSRYQDGPTLKLEYFHTFLCPVAMAEAMVKEHIIEDYDALELLVLRLYDIGFHSLDALTSLSGMNRDIVERALNSEIMVYHHIDDEEKKITEMGRKTLEENEKNGGTLVSHIMYSTPRRLQIEAATGTVIPAYLEEKSEYMKEILEERADGIVPRESVEQDEELCREINERIKEYKHLDILNEGDTIISIEKLQSTQIFYRWAYLAKFEGMKYPMIVMRGYKSIDKSGAASIRKGTYGMHIAVPLALSRTDAIYLKNNKMENPEVIVRNDDNFEYLLSAVRNFNLHYEDNGELSADV